MNEVNLTEAQSEIYHAVNADGYDLSYATLFGLLANWESIRNEQNLSILNETQRCAKLDVPRG